MKKKVIRKIIHIDMDAFFASVEQRDFPQYRNKALIVGGQPDSRGVVCTCSYEARKFGIHSAMPSFKAWKLCPNAIFVRPRMKAYKEVSSQIREIFYQYTHLVEPLSLDEAFIDVTENKLNIPYATETAIEIKKKIFEKTKLTASAGVSYNKFIAKVASDMNKPNGLTVVIPEKASEFIEKLPIRKFFGVGRVTEQKMFKIGIKTGGDLKNKNIDELIHYFGKNGTYYYNISRGIDTRPVVPNRTRKSLGSEITLSNDISEITLILQILAEIAIDVEKSLIYNNLKGKTITLKIKYADFKTLTRSITISKPTDSSKVMIENVRDLLKKTDAGNKKLRLLGISVSNFLDKERNIQLEFDFMKIFYE